ncbi:Dabb family protein [Desertivibrio insolitus]|uniref:Dabb family protein n=1 Tax=Herbiconiux sp. SYSU D00978 TaxID=2812562 RepID=UPI001A95F961|nr:Dabb family protein [Herbiconiux sp. SYSU D00978]
MIRHIVLWTFNGETDAERLEQGARAAAALQALPAMIPEIQSFTVASNTVDIDRNSDLALVAEFTDAAALKAYGDHPEHLKVVALMKQIVASRAAIDFEV